MGVKTRHGFAARLSLTLIGAVAVLGCEVSLPRAARPRTSFRLHGTPPDAVVIIDDENVGSIAVVAVRGVSLPEGTHQVTVEAPGYFPWDELVQASGANKRLDLAVDLIPIPK